MEVTPNRGHHLLDLQLTVRTTPEEVKQLRKYVDSIKDKYNDRQIYMLLDAIAAQGEAMTEPKPAFPIRAHA